MDNPSNTLRLVEFEYGGYRIALPLGCVRRVVASAEPAPLPGAGDVVLGVLNVAGELVVVVDLGRRLGLPDAPMLPSQQLLIVELSGFLAAVLVERIVGITVRAPMAAMPDRVGRSPFVAGTVRLDDGVCLLLDPRQFLFPGECTALAQALDKVADAGA
jgi:chemotaxis signal transduction protein